MSGATPILFIGTEGNQMLAAPDGLEVLLHNPELDMEGSLREIHLVAGQIVEQLDYEEQKPFEDPLQLLKVELNGRARGYLVSFGRSNAGVSLRKLATGLSRLKKERFEAAANSAMIHSGMAVLWSPPEAVRKQVAEAIRPTDDRDDHSLKGIVRRAKAQMEREIIERRLAEAHGDVTHAARRLGLSRKALQLKMKELGLR